MSKTFFFVLPKNKLKKSKIKSFEVAYHFKRSINISVAFLVILISKNYPATAQTNLNPNTGITDNDKSNL